MFAAAPYQGAAPERAEFLFVGLDANYAKWMGDSPFFARILEYHSDGPGFWRRNAVHHPFLLNEYPGDRRRDGCRYHREFAKIGFTSNHAGLVSFVEMLHVPTVGTSRLEPRDLSRAHVRWLGDVMLGGAAKHIFVSRDVVDLMQRTGEFPWFKSSGGRGTGQLIRLYERAGKSVFRHQHFSSTQEDKKREEAAAIRSLIPA